MEVSSEVLGPSVVYGPVPARRRVSKYKGNLDERNTHGSRIDKLEDFDCSITDRRALERCYSIPSLRSNHMRRNPPSIDGQTNLQVFHARSVERRQGRLGRGEVSREKVLVASRMETGRIDMDSKILHGGTSIPLLETRAHV